MQSETYDAVARMTLRMPEELYAYVTRAARHNFTSANAEIVRAIRKRMEREPKSASEGVAPPPKASPEA